MYRFINAASKMKVEMVAWNAFRSLSLLLVSVEVCLRLPGGSSYLREGMQLTFLHANAHKPVEKNKQTKNTV